ncbi:MAG: enoyl-CoA hydratase/isomerase family protein [Promethearchaeota archaeon]
MNLDYETVLFDRKGKVAVITLNRPEKLNALNLQMNKDLTAALRESKENEEIRVIVITGSGKAFCAGADVAEFSSGEFLNSTTKEDERILIHPYKLYKLEKPIIAAVNGVAVGFGTNLTLCCDITFASERASFGEFFIRMGIIPDMNGSLILPMLVGVHKAKELIFSGERIYADEALRIGLVNRVFPHDELIPKTMEFANNLAEKAPLAISLSKKAIHKAYEKIFDEMLAIEKEYNDKLYASEDHREAARAWVEKRKPIFKGR